MQSACEQLSKYLKEQPAGTEFDAKVVISIIQTDNETSIRIEILVHVILTDWGHVFDRECSEMLIQHGSRMFRLRSE